MSKPKTLREIVEAHPEWLDLPVDVIDINDRSHKLGVSAICRTSTYINLTTKESQERVEFLIK